MIVELPLLMRRSFNKENEIWLFGASNLFPAIDEMSTTDCVEVGAGIIESGPIDDPVGSRKLDPPRC